MAQLAELTENFKELRLKTPEEIEKAVVDESLSPVERAIFLLCSGEDVQKISVLADLAELLKSSPDEVQRRVLPKIREMIAVCSAELHQTASRTCVDILQKSILPPDVFAKHFLGMMITGIDSRDVDISVLWLDTLLEVVDLLPSDVVTAQILPKAQHFSHSNQPSQAKLAACKLLGRIAIRLPGTIQRKTEIMPHIKSLAQELEFEVRAAVCFQLSLIAKGLSPQEVKDLILPELLELCNDDDFHVRTAGLEAVVALAPQFDNDTIRVSALPFILKFFRESISGNTSALPAIAAVIGRVCTAFQTHLTTDEKQFCIECFKRLCTIGQSNDSLSSSLGKPAISAQALAAAKNSAHSLSMPNSLSLFPGKPLSDLEARPVMCRENAAANFPLMAQFSSLSRFKQDLRPCVTSLCADGNPLVRRSIAGCIHELVTLLDAEAHMLTKEMSMMLDDNNLDVLERIVANFDSIIAVLARNNFRIPATSDSRPTNSGIILVSLFNCDQTLSRALRWRLHVDLINKMSSLRLFCSSDIIHQKILPALFNRLASARQLPLKLACIRTILMMTRCMDRHEKWAEVFNRFADELLHSSNSYRRSLYVDLCHMVLELYSRAFFKANCLELVLSLAQDPVPNLRIRLCELLLKVKSIIRLPADRGLLQALESAIRKLLLNETDRAVSSVVIKTVEILDKIEVRMQQTGRSASLPSTAIPAAEVEAEAEDARKEEEEKLHQEADDKKEEGDSKKAEKGGEKAQPGKPGAAKPSANAAAATATSATPSTTTGTKRARTSKKPGPPGRELPSSTLTVGAGPPNSNGNGNGGELAVGPFPIPHSNSLSKTLLSTSTVGQLSKAGKPVPLSKTIPGYDDFVIDEIDNEEEEFEDEPYYYFSTPRSKLTSQQTPAIKVPAKGISQRAPVSSRRQSLPTIALSVGRSNASHQKLTKALSSTSSATLLQSPRTLTGVGSNSSETPRRTTSTGASKVSSTKN